VQSNNTQNRIVKKIKSTATCIGVALLFFACHNNNIDRIAAFNHPPGAPEIVADSFIMLYSDSAIMRFRLITPKLLVFSDVDEPFQEFPEGFTIEKFDNHMKIASSIKADYGKYFEKKELWEARHNVVALTESGDTLLTEELFWDERKNLIYSNIFVKVIRKDEHLWGEGFEADIQMSYWKFNTPKGNFYIEVEE
jgi:hypothetical protein